jgi:hypothetical protein
MFESCCHYAHTTPRGGISRGILLSYSISAARHALASPCVKQGISISIFDRSIARRTTNNVQSDQRHLQTRWVCIHNLFAQSSVHSFCICLFECSWGEKNNVRLCMLGETARSALRTIEIASGLRTPAAFFLHQVPRRDGWPLTSRPVCERSHSSMPGARSYESAAAGTTQTRIGLLLCDMNYWMISKHSGCPGVGVSLTCDWLIMARKIVSQADNYVSLMQRFARCQDHDTCSAT